MCRGPWCIRGYNDSYNLLELVQNIVNIRVISRTNIKS